MLFAFSVICLTNKFYGEELPSKRLTWGMRFPFDCTPHCFRVHSAYLQLVFAVSLEYKGSGESRNSVAGYTSSYLE